MFSADKSKLVMVTDRAEVDDAGLTIGPPVFSSTHAPLLISGLELYTK